MTSWRPSYFHSRTGEQAETIRQLYPLCSETERRVDPAYFAPYPAPGRTVVAGIRRGPGPLAGRPPFAAGDLRQTLSALFREHLAPIEPVPVAISGGIDSWVIAVLLQSLGYEVQGYYLRTNIVQYCEYDTVDYLSTHMNIRVKAIPASAADFAAALPRFLALTETPIYSLHPVSKLLLAEQLAARNVKFLITGDAADQVFRCERDCDLLPLTLTCVRSAGLRPILPFLSNAVQALCAAPDPAKRPLRELAFQLGLPELPKKASKYPGPSILRESTELLINHLKESTLCAALPA